MLVIDRGHKFKIMAIRMPFQEPDTVTSMPSRSLVFFGMRAYDLIATMNWLYGEVMRQNVSQARFEALRRIIEDVRYNDFPVGRMPNMPCPFCDDQATHWMPAAEWFRDHGVECYLENMDEDVIVVQRPAPEPIDLTESEDEGPPTPVNSSISSDDAVVEDRQMTNEEIFDVVLAEAIHYAMRDADENGPAPAA